MKEIMNPRGNHGHTGAIYNLVMNTYRHLLIAAKRIRESLRYVQIFKHLPDASRLGMFHHQHFHLGQMSYFTALLLLAAIKNVIILLFTYEVVGIQCSHVVP